MRGLAMLAIAGAVLLGPTLARADERVSGECLISVGGRAYLDGPCSITLYPGGGFQASGRGRHPTSRPWTSIPTPAAPRHSGTASMPRATRTTGSAPSSGRAAVG